MARKKNQQRSAPRKRAPKSVKPVVLANNQDVRPLPKRRLPKKKVNTNHVRNICQVTDPFCPAAKNSKWPDGTSGNTLTEQFRGTVNIVSDANGAACEVFNATFPFGYYDTTVVAGVATTAANMKTYKAGSMLATYGNQYRIVSFGCIVRNVASATQSAGLVTLGTVTTISQATAITLGQELYDEVTVKAIQPGLEVAWVSQPRGTEARAFTSQSVMAPAVASDWTSLVVEVQGAPAIVTMLSVEWYANVEFNINPLQRALTSIARPNPPKSSVAENSVSSVHSSIGSFIEGGVAQVESVVAKHASAALSSLLDDPFESIAGLFGF